MYHPHESKMKVCFICPSSLIYGSISTRTISGSLCVDKLQEGMSPELALGDVWIGEGRGLASTREVAGWELVDIQTGGKTTN